MDRRTFVKAGLMSTAGSAAGMVKASSRGDAPGREAEGTTEGPPSAAGWEINMFTKLVDRPEYGFSYDEIASLFGKAGVTGPNMTVRPGGMVEPDRVEKDMPRAVEAFRKHGLSTFIITTALTSAEDPAARRTLKTAGGLGIKYHQTGYMSHVDPARWKSTLESAASRAGFAGGCRTSGGHADAPVQPPGKCGRSSLGDLGACWTRSNRSGAAPILTSRMPRWRAE